MADRRRTVSWNDYSHRTSMAYRLIAKPSSPNNSRAIKSSDQLNLNIHEILESGVETICPGGVRISPTTSRTRYKSSIKALAENQTSM